MILKIFILRLSGSSKREEVWVGPFMIPIPFQRGFPGFMVFEYMPLPETVCGGKRGVGVNLLYTR